MTINIESMRAMVERMGPDQLRQFARMHSNDAIAMSLVSSRLTELNRAKASQQAQQTPAQPPKVVEQVAQSIPMEESGIAALPVQNMAMADGGIVGYSGGGILLPPREEGESFADYRNRAIASQDAQMQEKANAERAKAEEERLAELSRRGGPRVSPFIQPQNISPQQTGSVFTPGSQSGLRPELPPKKPGAGLAGLRQAPPPPKAAPKAASTAEPQMPAEAAEPTTQSVIDQYKEMQKALGGTDFSEVTAAQEKANAEARRVKEADLEATKKYWADRGDSSKGKEERISAREAALEKSKSSLEGMAWIQAGLETMSTAGSLGQAIAAGGKKGLSTYASGIEQYNMAKEKLDEARDKMEELRANRKDMSDKEIFAAEKDIRTTVLQGQQSLVPILTEQAKAKNTQAKDLMNIWANEKEGQRKTKDKTAEIASMEAIAEADRKSREKIAREGVAAKLPKPAITLDQAADNVSKFLDSTRGMTYISQVQKAAKESGKPVPDVYAIRKELIAKEMAKPAAAEPPTAPTMTAAQAAALAKYGVK